MEPQPLSDEHVIKCSICGRGLIVKDNVNNGVAFLSHLKNDHGVFYVLQRSVDTKTKSRDDRQGMEFQR